MTERRIECRCARSLIARGAPKLWTRWAAFIIAFFTLPMAPPAFAAAGAVVKVANDASGDSTKTITQTEQRLIQDIRLLNSASDQKEQRTYRPSDKLVRRSDGRTVDAVWTRMSPPLDTDTVAPGAELILRLSADLPDFGTYDTSIDFLASGADGQPTTATAQRVSVVVERTAKAIQADLLPTLPPAQLVWPNETGGVRILLRLWNQSSDPAYFDPPQVLSLTVKNGDSQIAVPVASLPRIDTKSCSSPLAPKKGCPVTLVLEDGLPPGEYSLDLNVSGTGGGVSKQTQVLRVRAAFALPFLTIAAGILGGVLLRYWRDQGRQTIAGFILIRAQRDRVEKLDLKGDTVMSSARVAILSDLDLASAKAEAGSSVEAEVQLITDRVKRLTVAAAAADAYDQLKDSAPELKQRRNTLIATLAKSSLEESERSILEASRVAFTADLQDWSDFVPKRGKMRELAAEFRSLLDQAGSAADDEAKDVLKKIDDANQAADQSLAPATATTDTVGARIEALQKARKDFDAKAREFLKSVAKKQIAALGQKPADAQQAVKRQSDVEALTAFQSSVDTSETGAAMKNLAALLKSTAPPNATTEAIPTGAGLAREATPDIPPIDLSGLHVLGALSDDSVADLREKAWWWDFWTNLLILVVTALSGVLALSNRSTWGSTEDFITLFIAGLAARLVLGEVGGVLKTTQKTAKQ